MFNPLDHPICLAEPDRTGPTPRLQHVPFAMFLVDALRPEVLVALGTSDGLVYDGFRQAVRELGLGTRCFAVDDGRAETLDSVGAFSRRLPGHASRALDHFADGSIDLLQVDDAAALDAEGGLAPWIGKISRRGVVLLHDDGARRSWESSRSEYPEIASYHQDGLVVLAVGEPGPGPLRDLLGEPDGVSATRARRFFFRLGEGLRAAWERDEAVAALRDRDELERQARRGADLLAEKERTIRGLVADLAEKERTIRELRPRLAEKEHRLLASEVVRRPGPAAWLRSRGEGPWRLARRGLGVWRREGFRSLVRKAQRKLDHAWNRGH